MGSNTLRAVPKLSLLSYVNGSNNDQVKFVNDLYKGLIDYGFIILEDHIVDKKLVDKAYGVFHDFFSRDLNFKKQYLLEGDGGQRGFTSFGKEHAKDNAKPDLKEFWHVGRELPDEHEFHKYYPKNLWVNEIPNFKEVAGTLYNQLDKTSEVLLHALGRALDLPENFFKEMITDGNSILRAIHYPPIEKGVDPGCVRAAAHEDINLITILVGATDGGLELLDKDGTWLPVSTEEHQLIVDSGDMMKRLTNDVIPATTHRVVNPKDLSTTRYSMPFFVHPHPEASLACIPSCVGAGKKYEDISSHDFLMERLYEIGLM
jgi:isopenicillin N synthase-like dioxygenase